MYGGEPMGSNSNIGRITPSGVITEFPVPPYAQLTDITAGPDGNLWFTKSGCQIGRITPSGVIALFPVPFVTQCSPWGITEGPDHNIWFTDSSSDRILQLIISTAPDITHTIIALAVGYGTIDPIGTVPGINHGATQTFTIDPVNDYKVVMSGTCGGNIDPNTASYTTNPITQDCSVNATFIPIPIGPTQELQLPGGDNVQVLVPVTNPPGGLITITFDHIETAGVLTVVETQCPAGNTGITFIQTCYDIHFDGTLAPGSFISVTIPYALDSLPVPEYQLFILHDGVPCTPSTIGTTNDPNIHTLTCQVTSLSPFGIGYYTSGGGYSTGANTNMIAILAFLAVSTGVFLMRKYRVA